MLSQTGLRSDLSYSNSSDNIPNYRPSSLEYIRTIEHDGSLCTFSEKYNDPTFDVYDNQKITGCSSYALHIYNHLEFNNPHTGGTVRKSTLSNNLQTFLLNKGIPVSCFLTQMVDLHR